MGVCRIVSFTICCNLTLICIATFVLFGTVKLNESQAMTCENNDPLCLQIKSNTIDLGRALIASGCVLTLFLLLTGCFCFCCGRKSTVNPRQIEVTVISCRGTCTICSLEMCAGAKIKCGHVFHVRCIYGHVERDRSCPICEEAL